MKANKRLIQLVIVLIFLNLIITIFFECMDIPDFVTFATNLVLDIFVASKLDWI